MCSIMQLQQVAICAFVKATIRTLTVQNNSVIKNTCVGLGASLTVCAFFTVG